ncbi:MAG: exonuclease domain-containing protein [Christensenellales bacterium]|jgi:DNA polymerase-3 subunit epsilon
MEKYHRGNYVRKICKDYCVLDTETTGLSAYTNCIIEIGILRVRDNIVVAEYSQLIDPECELDPYITNLTGITQKMLEGQPTIDSVKDEVLAFIGDDIVVGHNTHFDMQFLANGFCYDFPYEYMDTLQFARKLYPEFSGHSLGMLASQLGLPTVGHRALGDCRSTKALLDCMVTKMLDANMTVEQVFLLKRKKAPHNRFNISQIVPTEEKNEDSCFYGKHCIFTDTLEKMIRKDAMQLVVNVGGILDESVCSTTDFLIFGSFDYYRSIKEGRTRELNKAKALKQKGHSIEIIDEHTLS